MCNVHRNVIQIMDENGFLMSVFLVCFLVFFSFFFPFFFLITDIFTRVTVQKLYQKQ